MTYLIDPIRLVQRAKTLKLVPRIIDVIVDPGPCQLGRICVEKGPELSAERGRFVLPEAFGMQR